MKYSKAGLLTHLICLSVILLTGIYIYRNIIFSKGPAFQANDIRLLYYPVFYFAKHAFLSGQFPLWDPYQLFGQPIAFNGYPVLYPPMLIFLLLPFKELLPRYVELFIVWHIIIAGVTFYYSALRLRLGKYGSLIASIVFLAAPTVSSFIFMPPAAFMMPWLPLFLSFTITTLSSKKALREEKGDFIRLVLILSMIYLCMSPPILVYVIMTIALISFYILFSRMSLSALFLLTRKLSAIVVTVIALNAFSIIPFFTYLKETVRSIPMPQNVGIGPLYTAHIWTLLFPKFAFGMSDSFAYTGILPLLLTLLAVYVGRRFHSRLLGLVAFLGSFWFLFAIENSPLYRLLARLPVLSSLRFSYRGLLFYVVAISIMTGIIIEYFRGRPFGSAQGREMKSGESSGIFNSLFQLCLPFVLLISLIISYESFVKVRRDHPLFADGGYLMFYLRNFGPAILGISAIMFFGCMKRLKKFYNIFWLVPLVSMISDYSLNYGLPVERSSALPFYPYDEKVEQFKNEFPEVLKNNPALYRIENFGEEPIIPYYYRYLSVNGNGFLHQGTHPRSYYYLWSKGGGWYGHTNQKPYIDIMKDATCISSPLYSLMGVKYFLISEEGAASRIIPYEERGKGEYIEVIFKNPIKLAGIKIINPEGEFKRRATKVQLLSGGMIIGAYDLENKSGEQLVKFSPVTMKDLRMTVLDVGLAGFPTSDNVFIQELIFLDEQGLPCEIEDISTSSTFFMSDNSYLIDGKDTSWESGNIIGIRKKMAEGGCSPSSDVSGPGKSKNDRLFFKPNPMPRAFLVSDYKVTNDERELLDLLHGVEFDPRRTVLLYKPEIPPVTEISNYYTPAEIDDFKLNRIKISVVNNKPGILVLTDAFSNSWKVYVNGRKSRIMRAYGVFRAVAIPLVGNNEVIFEYLPPYFKIGAIISIVSVAVVGMWYRN